MKILLGFKASPDLSMMAEKDWQAGDSLQIDVSFTQTMLNCFDESAAELMLMVRDSTGWKEDELSLSALTIDDRRGEHYLKQMYALGFQSAIRIDPMSSIDLRFNPLAVAKIMQAYHQQIDQQSLIVLGMQSSEGHNMQTAMLLAELLNWPCITQVSDFRVIRETRQVIVIRQTEDEQQTLTIETPAVLAVGNSTQASALRVPTLKQKLAGAKNSIHHYSPEQLGLTPQALQQENDKQLTKLTRQQNRRGGVIITGSTPEEKARRLYHDYLQGRLG
ncbi:electron transfer flavoprotein subunit beta/FixA family protein [Limnobaculum parvum]|uniref:Electron transfer flavoprotein subunit beta/FixA family protein n=1 Tax=Limnobaculum parvum TaxID=2172103 RepID=A0A2Y9TX29_9GAMM|nr:hypothetical protein [Limnobaculum parvum]AWH88162.1 electron transfer flavoprotein subunit beta/FixA family protein [Limnobaculum parvum]